MTTGATLTKNGFNMLVEKAFNSASTKTVVSRFKIGTGTTTPAQGDTNLATPITGWAPGSSDYKNFNTATTYDTANQKAATQGFVASTEANGNSITEYGEFNTDDSPLMFMRTVFTAITKTSATQMFITTTYKRQ